MVKHGETKGRIVSPFRLVELVAMLSFDKVIRFYVSPAAASSRATCGTSQQKKGDPRNIAPKKGGDQARKCAIKKAGLFAAAGQPLPKGRPGRGGRG